MRSIALSARRLAAITLGRQFPAIRGRDRTALTRLFDRLGPVQSQVPRAPFLTAASRLPGVDYQTVRDAFADHELLRSTNLRGTVHTTRPAVFPAVDAVSRQVRAVVQRRTLGLADAGVPVEDLVRQIEQHCTGDWRPRDELTEASLRWLAERGARVSPGSSSTFAANLIWGHSGLLRRPRDDHWERRTDAFHRTAVDVLGGAVAPAGFASAVVDLVRSHLGAYGPATRQDIAWWAGVGLTAVDRALQQLGSELTRCTGPDGEQLIDLESAPSRTSDPGLRLLPEYDGLLLGYAPAHRDRFLDREHLHRIWARANGLFAPAVLLDGRIRGGWRTVPGRPAGDTIIEVTPFTRDSGITEDLLDGPVADTARALQLTVSDVRLVPPA